MKVLTGRWQRQSDSAAALPHLQLWGVSLNNRKQASGEQDGGWGMAHGQINASWRRGGGGRRLQPQGAIAAGRGGGCGRGRGRAIREPATLPAFRHLVRKCALVHISVREAAGREGLILTHQNRDCD